MNEMKFLKDCFRFYTKYDEMALCNIALAKVTVATSRLEGWTRNVIIESFVSIRKNQWDTFMGYPTTISFFFLNLSLVSLFLES